MSHETARERSLRLRLLLLIDAGAKHVPLRLAQHVVNNAYTPIFLAEDEGRRFTGAEVRERLTRSWEAPGTRFHYETPDVTSLMRARAVEAIVAEHEKYEELLTLVGCRNAR